MLAEGIREEANRTEAQGPQALRRTGDLDRQFRIAQFGEMPMRSGVRTDLHGPTDQIGERSVAEEGERAPATRYIPFIRSTQTVAHDEDNGSNTALREERESRLGEASVAIIERQQERTPRQTAAPLEKAHELVWFDEAIASPLQRVQLALELIRRNTVRLENRVAGKVRDGVIAEDSKRMRARHASPAVNASPVLDGPHGEERQRRQSIGTPAIDPRDDESPQRRRRESRQSRRQEHRAPQQAMQPRLRALRREDRRRGIRVFAHEGDVGFSHLRVLGQMRGRVDDIPLAADGARIVHHAVTALNEPVREVEILVPIAAAGGESLVESAECLEHRAPDRELAVHELIEPRCVPGLGHAPRLGLGPGAHPLGEQVGRGVRMERDDASHRVRSHPVTPVMFSEQLGVRLHVVVEKEQDLSSRFRRTPVAGAGQPAIRLGNHTHGKSDGERAKRVGGAVGRAIDDHDRLERPIVPLMVERPDQAHDQIATLEGRYDHGDASPCIHRRSSRRTIAPPPSSSTPLHHSTAHTTSQSRYSRAPAWPRPIAPSTNRRRGRNRAAALGAASTSDPTARWIRARCIPVRNRRGAHAGCLRAKRTSLRPSARARWSATRGSVTQSTATTMSGLQTTR
ncbi:MAG TPA: hypothetical protein VFJ96_02615, partial [Gemmatimonadaceae bacterium]|nr:hypothetical protein [Gemmatimonadaceae bacterium]